LKNTQAGYDVIEIVNHRTWTGCDVIVKRRTRHEHSGVHQATAGNVCPKARKNPRSRKNHA